MMSDIGTIPVHEYTSKVITDRTYSDYFQSIPPKFLSHVLIFRVLLKRMQIHIV